MIPGGRLTGVSAVIVDDNDTTRAMLRAILRAEGIEVVGEAKDGDSGMATLRRCTPHLVFLDIHMPTVSGIDVLAQVRGEMPGMRVVIISGSTDRETVQAAVEGGAHAYLIKPFRAASVLDAIRKAISVRVEAPESSPSTPAAE